MIEVPEDNAFAVTVVGTAGLPFPYSLSWEPFGEDIFASISLACGPGTSRISCRRG